jgi:hypothetical protein
MTRDGGTDRRGAMTDPGRNDMVWIVTQWTDDDRAIRGVYRHARDAYARAAELTHGQVERDGVSTLMARRER